MVDGPNCVVDLVLAVGEGARYWDRQLTLHDTPRDL